MIYSVESNQSIIIWTRHKNQNFYQIKFKKSKKKINWWRKRLL